MNKICLTASCLLVLASTALMPQEASAQTNFGSLAVGGSGTTTTVTVTIPHGGEINTIQVLTGGAPNLDFLNAGGGTCALNATYADNSSCTVKVSFQPKFPGVRYGGVILSLSTNFFPTAYLQGSGLGPQTAFTPQALVELGSVPALAGLQSDGQKIAFFNSGEVNDGSGGPGGEIDGYRGSFPAVTGLNESILPATDPDAIVVDGAGNLCFYDGQFQYAPSAYVPAGAGNYAVNPNDSTCPMVNQKGVTDGGGNFYTLPGPTKLTRQSNGSFVSSSVSTLTGTDLAVDGAGDVYVAAGELYKETPQSGGAYTQTVVPLTIDGITNVSIDGVGDLYLTASTGLFKETLQANGSYVQSPLAIGSSDPNNVQITAANTQIEWSDLFGNLYLATLTDNSYYDAFYSDVYSLSNSQPATLSFAATAAGSTSTDSPKTITVTNSGNEPLKIAAITYPADFSAGAAATGACAAGASVAQGANCTLAIDFTPKASAAAGSTTTLSESVLLITNALNHASTQQAIPVTGVETSGQVTLKLSSSSSVYGGNVTATVSLSSGTAAPTLAPTGTVKIMLDGTTLLETLTLSGSGHGTASASGNFGGVSAGTHSITAVYSGDSKNPASTSPAVPYTVTRAAVTLTASCSASPIVLGASYSCHVYTAPISAGAPGTLMYTLDSGDFVSVPLSSGTAYITPTPTYTGAHTLVIYYASQGNYNPATPITKSFTVNAAK